MSEIDSDITPGVARALNRLGIDVHSAEQISDAYAAGRWILAQHTKTLKDELENELRLRARRERRWVWALAILVLVTSPFVTILATYLSRIYL
jgi:hypothetical protein